MRRRHWSAAGIIGRHYSNDFLEKRDSNIFFTIPTYLVEIFWVRIVVRGGILPMCGTKIVFFWGGGGAGGHLFNKK